MKKYDVVATASIPGKDLGDDGGSLDIYKMRLLNTGMYSYGPESGGRYRLPALWPLAYAFWQTIRGRGTLFTNQRNIK
jgi:hypothetical protein